MGAKKKAKKAKRLEREHRAILQDLRANRRRRDKLTARFGEERVVLSKLLFTGVAAGMAVAELAEKAGISRIHAHRLLAVEEASRAGSDQPVDASDVSSDQATALDGGNPSAAGVEPGEPGASSGAAPQSDGSANGPGQQSADASPG